MTNKWISFLIENEKYCANISDVKDVLPYAEPNPFPGSNEHTKGILSIRGEIITILDGDKIFSCRNITPKNNIIIIEDESNTLLGVSVDGIDQIIEFDPSQIDQSNEVQQPNEPQDTLVIGTINTQGQLYIVIDFARLIAQQRGLSDRQTLVSSD